MFHETTFFSEAYTSIMFSILKLMHRGLGIKDLIAFIFFKRPVIPRSLESFVDIGLVDLQRKSNMRKRVETETNRR